MAELSLRAPEPLTVDVTSTSMAQTWELWLEHLKMYFIAADIKDPNRGGRS